MGPTLALFSASQQVEETFCSVGDPKHCGFVWPLHPSAPGSNHNHAIYAFMHNLIRDTNIKKQSNPSGFFVGVLNYISSLICETNLTII